MTLITIPQRNDANSAPNPTLKGHKLLIAIPLDFPPSILEAIASQFPDLQIVSQKLEWGQRTIACSADEWKDVTLLMTFAGLPTPEEAPKLQLVQLVSAGANHVLESPLFKDTDVIFCTANGVHG